MTFVIIFMALVLLSLYEIIKQIIDIKYLIKDICNILNTKTK